jgi:hypothetical protein
MGDNQLGFVQAYLTGFDAVRSEGVVQMALYLFASHSGGPSLD